MDKKIDDFILNARKIDDLYSLWKVHEKSNTSTSKLSHLKVIILNNPCMGFGDIVFAIKLSKYIEDWFGCSVTVATTQPDGFKKMGFGEQNLVLLKSMSDRTQREPSITPTIHG